MTLEIDLLTLFPAMVEGPLSGSIPARIQEQGLATIRVHDLRRWGLGRHRTVDDYPYGGGAGMVLRPEPVAAALAELRRADTTVILMDAAGEAFRQERAQDLAGRSHLLIICPRYEGVDERIRTMADLELSIGDYVLTGGELPALVVVDAVIRLLPGAIAAPFTAGGSRSHSAARSSAGRTSWPSATSRRRSGGSSTSWRQMRRMPVPTDQEDWLHGWTPPMRTLERGSGIVVLAETASGSRLSLKAPRPAIDRFPERIAYW